MSPDPSAHSRSTTAARVATTNGPAAIAEARKNKKKRTKECDAAEPTSPASTRYTPSKIILSVPAEAIVVDNDLSSPAYPPSEPSPTPPPIPMPPFFNEDTPSPPPSPSIRAENTFTPRPSTAPLPPANDPAPPPASQDTDIPMSTPTDPQDEPEDTSVRTLVENTPKNSSLISRNAPRDPIDKYMNVTMPKIHDDHPTSAFNYIDLDLVSIWEKFTGGKILVIPFGDIAHNPDLHEPIKNRILFAMAEITQSTGVGVSAPTPSAEATQSKRYPSSFLVYNLTKPQKNLILDRGVWSSQAITFRATTFFPTIPKYMFTIKGFSTLNNVDVNVIINAVWHDNDTATFAQSIVDAAPDKDRSSLTNALRTLLNSMKTTCLEIKERGGALTPRYNVYANGTLIPRHTIWLELRSYLANRIYFTPMHGRGSTLISPFNCGICHGVDHPRGLCTFPDIPGWNGPGKNSEPCRDQNGGQFGRPRRGAGSSFNNSTFRM